jgi:hypothetical protein
MTAVMASHTYLRGRAEHRPRLADIAVLLPEMHAIRAQSFRKGDAVVDDQRDARVGTDALERIGETRKLMLGNVLHPQLKGRDAIDLDHGTKTFREIVAHVLGRDKIQTARLCPRRRRELRRIEIVQQG